MARYNSNTTEEPGQYPTMAWSSFGLPEQTQGTGAPGSSRPSSEVDQGETNEPGQYPSRELFSGVVLGGTGAPGTTGASSTPNSGSDSATWSRVSFYKSEREGGGMSEGAITETASGTVSGQGDWTQANDEGYQAAPRLQMPGVRGNTPAPGDGRYQTGGGSVMYGGRLNGTNHTSSHPSHSGPGT